MKIREEIRRRAQSEDRWEFVTTEEWYEGLPRWRRAVFHSVARLVGFDRALRWC